MTTRRQTLFLLGNLFTFGGLVGAGASETVSSASSASFRVVGSDDADIELTPANDSPVHVETDSDGAVSAITPGGNEDGLNVRAVTRFEDIVQLTNVGTKTIEGIFFSFEATSETLSATTLDAIEAALAATTAETTLDSSGPTGDDLLTASSVEAAADGSLEPGEVVSFGIQVDLVPNGGAQSLETLPPSDEYEVTLRIHTELPEA